MKLKIFLAFAYVLTIFSCQKSIIEKASEEAEIYTNKKCPYQAADNIVMDSMTFDATTLTFGYHYHLTGGLDSVGIVDSLTLAAELTKGLRNDPSVRAYIENSFRFRYVYKSTKKPGETLFETMLTPEELR